MIDEAEQIESYRTYLRVHRKLAHEIFPRVISESIQSLPTLVHAQTSLQLIVPKMLLSISRKVFD